MLDLDPLGNQLFFTKCISIYYHGLMMGKVKTPRLFHILFDTSGFGFGCNVSIGDDIQNYRGGGV